MKRDPDLIRKILIEVENQNGPITSDMLNIEGFSKKEIIYHCELLIEAGLLDGEVAKFYGGGDNFCTINRLSWDGHEFLDAARNENVWKKAMKVMTETGGGFVLELAKPILIDLLKQQIISGIS